MSFIVRLLIGIVMAAVGIGFVLKTESVVGFFGPVEWAERHVGSTGMFYKLVGVLVIFLGFLWVTNLWDAFLSVTIGNLIPGLRH
jgi:hypothetical protein